MTADVPRRLPRTQGQRVQNVVRTHAAQSLGGATAAARPVQNTTPTPTIYRPPTTGGGTTERLSLFYRVSSVGTQPAADKVYIVDWTATTESAAPTRLAIDPTGGINVLADGVYAVNLALHVEGVRNAAAACSVFAFCDVAAPDTGSFACVTRGGDSSSGLLNPAASRTYFAPAGSDVFWPGVGWDNLDTTNVTGISLFFEVQAIS